MPSANGVYSLPVGYLATTGTTILSSQHNPPLEDIAEALTGRLSRDGTAPMTGALKLAGGSAAAPGLTFQSDTSTGPSKTTNGFGVSVGGVQVAEFTAGGLASGSRFIGELIPYSGATAPTLTVMPYGQTLSRTAYAALWAFAQAQITAGSTFYNNGDGSSTFGIGDLRGRVVAGNDAMGGVAASRLTSTYFGANGAVPGSVGGLESNTLITAQVPVHSHANTLSDPGHSHRLQMNADAGVVGGTSGFRFTGAIAFDTNTATTGITITNANAGSGAAHNNVQPSIITNYLLFAGA